MPGAHLNNFCHVDPDPEFGSGVFKDNVVTARKKKDHKEARAGYWGPVPGTECDTSIQLANATFDYIHREIMHHQGGIDFVIWTGDNARHDNDNRYPRTLKQIYDSNEFMVNKMQELFGRDRYSDHFIPVVPTLGNNDVYPHNILFAGPNSKTISHYKQMWRDWVPPEQSHTFDRGAYFHMSVAPKLSVVSLNSLYFYENNKAVDGCSSKEEPGSLQLDWLEIQLKLFRQQGIKAWIIGHIPPTERQWYDGCYDRYANLVIEFRDLIVGQLFGHVNIDHFYFTKHKDAASVRATESSSSVDTLTESSQKQVHILKNPLDVLTDARVIFDELPQYSAEMRSSSKEAIDSTIGHLAVVNVSPSVVPNYYPTLRVYEYLTNEPELSGLEQAEPLIEHKDAKDDGQVHSEKKGKRKKKKKSKKPKLPPVDHLGPSYIKQKYTPMKYVQYYLNTTEANANHTANKIDFQIEYDTTEQPYSMPDLTVASWVNLGNEISGLHGRGKLSEPSIDQDHGSQNINDFGGGPETTDFEPMALSRETTKGKKKHRSHKKKNKRNDGFWALFVFRGFVSTGLEHEYYIE